MTESSSRTKTESKLDTPTETKVESNYHPSPIIVKEFVSDKIGSTSEIILDDPVEPWLSEFLKTLPPDCYVVNGVNWKGISIIEPGITAMDPGDCRFAPEPRSAKMIIRDNVAMESANVRPVSLTLKYISLWSCRIGDLTPTDQLLSQPSNQFACGNGARRYMKIIIFGTKDEVASMFENVRFDCNHKNSPKAGLVALHVRDMLMLGHATHSPTKLCHDGKLALLPESRMISPPPRIAKFYGVSGTRDFPSKYITNYPLDILASLAMLEEFVQEDQYVLSVIEKHGDDPECITMFIRGASTCSHKEVANRLLKRRLNARPARPIWNGRIKTSRVPNAYTFYIEARMLRAIESTTDVVDEWEPFTIAECVIYGSYEEILGLLQNIPEDISAGNCVGIIAIKRDEMRAILRDAISKGHENVLSRVTECNV